MNHVIYGEPALLRYFVINTLDPILYRTVSKLNAPETLIVKSPH